MIAEINRSVRRLNARRSTAGGSIDHCHEIILSKQPAAPSASARAPCTRHPWWRCRRRRSRAERLSVAEWSVAALRDAVLGGLPQAFLIWAEITGSAAAA